MKKQLARRLSVLLVMLGVIGGISLVARRASACSCLQPTVESSYNMSSDVVTARLLYSVNVGTNRWYLARVLETYKGCIEAGDWVLITTPSSSAACGARFGSGREYLVNGQNDGSLFGVPRISVTSCGYNRAVSELTTGDRAFLEGRTVCCGGDCQCADGSQPVQCLVDPCSVAPPCSEGECVANYCGGCNAEFYDEQGYAVCQASPSCASDADCPADTWCREAAPGSNSTTAEPRYECVPFVAEGATCNGFTLPWFYERCSAGLECDTPDMIADAPGTCRRPCRTSADCDDNQYCANDQLCDRDGRCEADVDCDLPGNDYAHIECIGHGVCESGFTCGWVCDESGVQACQTDADCMRTGCSGQVCAAQAVITTCEWRDEYACYADPAITTCGCQGSRCAWAQTSALQQCLDAAAP